MRLYVALLDALSPGARVAQAAHAVTEMALVHPDAFRAWRDGTNTVVALAVDGDALDALLVAAHVGGDVAVEFREPDRGDERTAVAIFPRAAAVRRLLRRAPLAS